MSVKEPAHNVVLHWSRRVSRSWFLVMAAWYGRLYESLCQSHACHGLWTGPFGYAIWGMVSPDPFAAQGYMMPVIPPQRIWNGYECWTSSNEQEFEARKADLRRRRENERRAEREFPRDREFGREVSSGGDVSSMKSHRHHRSELPAKASSETTAKPASSAIADRKQKASVFSRISFPEEELAKKKRKLSSSGEAPVAVAGGSSASSDHHKSSSTANGYYDDYNSSSVKATSVSASGGGKKSNSSAAMDYESSDDERHFKRKPSRYEASPHHQQSGKRMPSIQEGQEKGTGNASIGRHFVEAARNVVLLDG
ncbi:hypothetical protein GH714_030409 [Hevea brasiliensis]|uniref:Uncharacterized protein n=1 Tax=Hevea brasiliensis TaxID=3981 RepID=A0A6A6LF33_HEVBR|nr:hypothetical protein GH714_030409 [Hevea brasiliensis]